MLQEIGLPDPRFTNLHDLELWVRLASRHELGFISRPLTAFRIRSGQKNLSAARPDTQLRGQFETCFILKHYARMPPALISEIFAPELGDRHFADARDAKRFVAELAMKIPLPSYRLFAMQTLFEAAEDRDDYERLRTLSGQTDLFNFLDARINPNNRSFGTRLYQYLRRRVTS